MGASLPAARAPETDVARDRAVPADRRRTLHRMKAMFWLYLVLIWGGIAYFSVIGITHH
jgi:hypothetical protein